MTSRRAVAASVLAGIVLSLPLSSAALAPALGLLIKQFVQQAVITGVKDMLLGSLRDMGCKGMALANGLTALDARGSAAGLAGLAGGLGPTALPGLPGGAALPGLPGMADIAAMMPPGTALPPEQAAMLAQMQRAMAQPLSPAQTAAAIDEMAELGLLPRPIQTEMKECMTLLPQTAPALGMAMAMMQPVVPQLREARQQLRALSPAEQDEMAEVMAGELRGLAPNERALFLEQIDGGFFPPAVASGVKARLSPR